MAANNKKVNIKCEKSPMFRTVHVDGVTGYANKDKKVVVCTLFSEFAELPSKFVHLVTEEGKLGEGSPVAASLMREFEVQLVLNPVVAENLMGHLREKLDELKQ